jgi:hypothetical protein
MAQPMSRRPRKYIPMQQKLAAALACLLPIKVRARMRNDRMSAAAVIRCFTFDHISLHAWGGSGVDKWDNLDPWLRGPELKAKDRTDTARAAKARRIDDKWRDFTRALASGRKPRRKPSRWPKRRMR